MATYRLNQDPETFTWEQFVAENPDLCADDVTSVELLDVGESITLFIGAGGEQTITRLT